MVGTSISGLITCLLRIVTKGTIPLMTSGGVENTAGELRASALLYFAVASLFVVTWCVCTLRSLVPDFVAHVIAALPHQLFEPVTSSNRRHDPKLVAPATGARYSPVSTL